MPILYIMCGIGFSGKSTLAKKIAEYTGATLVSQDVLFFEKEKELGLDLDNGKDWKKIIEMCKERIKHHLSRGKSVVFDNTNVKYSHRERLRVLAKLTKSDTKVIFLDTPIHIQKERQENNKISKERHDVAQEYLDQAIAELKIPTEDENVLVFRPDDKIEDFVKKL